MYREIIEMEKRLLAKENESIGDNNMGSRHDLSGGGGAVEPGVQVQKWIKLVEAHKAYILLLCFLSFCSCRWMSIFFS